MPNVPGQVSPLAFGMISCASRRHDKSAEGMGISCTGPLALFVSLLKAVFQQTNSGVEIIELQNSVEVVVRDGSFLLRLSGSLDNPDIHLAVTPLGSVYRKTVRETRQWEGIPDDGHKI